MVHSAPQDELKLVATSAADDAGFVALHDVAMILHLPEFRTGLLIGGHMVSLHAQRKLGDLPGAAAAASRALVVNPRSPEAHAVMAESLEADGSNDKATASRHRAEFYGWLAPFANTSFDEGRYNIVRKIAVAPEGDDEKKGAAWAKRRLEAIKELLATESDFSNDVLATLALHHGDHGEWEDRAYSALEKRGAGDLLLGILTHAQSTCTLKSASRALARLRHPGALDALVRILPEDVRAFMYADIAGSLALLGDVRAVPHLVDVLRPMQPLAEAPEDDPMHSASGITEARQRAALALGSFNTPESKKALLDCIDTGAFAVYCHAALFVLGEGEEHFAPVAKKLVGDNGHLEFELIRLLKTVDNSKVQKLVKDVEAKSPF